MSIVKNWENRYPKYIATCDICGAELRPTKDFMGAVDAKKASGWRSRKTINGWEDWCTDCQEKEKKDYDGA